MRFYTARQVIHDAFMPDITCIDTSAMMIEFGIQHTAKGAGNKIMDHCEKGIIQQALAVQKVKDRLGWAWNMFAYTPPGTGQGFERSTLLEWLARRHIEKKAGNPFLEPRLMNLARIAMHDIAQEDRVGKRRRRKYRELAMTVGVSAEEYERDWHPHYIRFRGYLQALPERSLPPIAAVVWCLVDKATGTPEEAWEAAEDLRGLLKMPAPESEAEERIVDKPN